MRLGMRPFGAGGYPNQGPGQYYMNEAAEKAKKAADLQAKIQARLTKQPGLVNIPVFLS